MVTETLSLAAECALKAGTMFSFGKDNGDNGSEKDKNGKSGEQGQDGQTQDGKSQDGKAADSKADSKKKTGKDQPAPAEAQLGQPLPEAPRSTATGPAKKNRDRLDPNKLTDFQVMPHSHCSPFTN